MDEVEAATGDRFALAIAHHAFMNTVVLRDVNRRRVAVGRDRMPLLCFAHGTELKMYAHERRGDQPDEFPLRFLPFMQRERIFDFADPEHGVDVVAAISAEQVEAFLDVFPEFPRERVVLSPNGYNQDVFRRLTEPTDVYADRADGPRRLHHPAARRAAAVSRSRWRRPTGSTRSWCSAASSPTGSGWTRCCAPPRSYERPQPRILTLVVGSGPHEAQVQMHDLAAELGLRRTYFLGPRPQDELAVLFSCADVGCFPSYREPFGLVFLECMACGTPVIGADSGGPRDFVTPEVGTLVPETDDPREFVASLAATVTRAIGEDWKRTKGPAAEAYARDNFSVVHQVSGLLAAVDRLTARPDRRRPAGRLRRSHPGRRRVAPAVTGQPAGSRFVGVRPNW